MTNIATPPTDLEHYPLMQWSSLELDLSSLEVGDTTWGIHH